ncbi:hypothetical protein E4U61_002656 [Claviceps capensis]|nr:hypothetical protein E4U61_002656 [Claviceps capensis]
MLPDSPRLQSSGSTLVTVGQDADRLITELDRDRAMCAAFDQVAAGYASGPGHILAQEFKQQYIRFWTAALKGESPPPPPPPRAAAPKSAAKTTTYTSVASQPEGPTSYTLKTQRSSKRAIQRAKASPAEDLRILVRLEPDAPTWDKDAYAIRRAVADRSEIPLHRVPAATRTKTGWAIKSTDAPTRDLLMAKEASWSSTLGNSLRLTATSLTGESIDFLDAAKEEVLTQTAWQPVDSSSATSRGYQEKIVAFKFELWVWHRGRLGKHPGLPSQNLEVISSNAELKHAYNENSPRPSLNLQAMILP